MVRQSSKRNSRTNNHSQKDFEPGKRKHPEGEVGHKKKNMNEILGIPHLNIETDGEETEDEEVKDDTEGPWLMKQGKKFIVEEESQDLIQMDIHDVQEELQFWQPSVYCFVLGANPPLEVIEGYIRRIWGKLDVDRVSLLPKGIFLVRFKTMEMRNRALAMEYLLFDNKPFIVKEWNSELELTKEGIKKVPVWIRMHLLPLKFWGKCLPKIAGIVGTFVKKDGATEAKTRLTFARVMVEVDVGQKLTECSKFKDEEGKTVEIKIEYEWKPVLCTKCQGYGHEAKACKRGPSKPESKQQPIRREWRPTQKEPQQQMNQVQPNDVQQGSKENLVVDRVVVTREPEAPNRGQEDQSTPPGQMINPQGVSSQDHELKGPTYLQVLSESSGVPKEGIGVIRSEKLNFNDV